MTDRTSPDVFPDVVKVGDKLEISTELIEQWRENPLHRSGIARVVKIEREGDLVVLWLTNDVDEKRP